MFSRPSARNFLFASLVLACSLGLSGCSNEAEKKLADAQQQLSQLQQENQRLLAENTQLKAAADARLMERAAQMQEAATAPPATTGFTDITGNFAEKQILELAKLEVFETTSGEFNPNGTISRAEFIRWLVRKQQKTEKNPIRLAEGGEATFADVPPDHPDFKYIQALVNAGYVIGFDAKSFRPDEPVTREMLIGLIIGLRGPNRISMETGQAVVKGGYTDYAKFSDRYVAAFYWAGGLVPKVFGPLKTFNPQKPVTRAEAAIAVTEASFR